MRVTVIDYRMGNVGSVCNAFEAIGAEIRLSNQASDLRWADCLVLPGVGAFEDGMNNLRNLGLVEQLNGLVLEEKKPFLGICIGLQLLANKGFENGEFEGLGWMDADVVRFQLDDPSLKVPHVGWNDVTSVVDNPLLGEKGTTHSFYFVHSYYLKANDPDITIGTCDYGFDFPAVIQKDNIFAVQFHPEKSQKNGLKVLKNYVELASKECAAC